MLTKRSVDQLIRALQSEKSAWLPIHKQLCIFLDYSLHQIVILDSKLFPAHQAEMGCWKVSLPINDRNCLRMIVATEQIH